MRIAIIDNGTVINIIEAESLDAAQSLGYPNVADDSAGTAVLGGTYADGVFTAPIAPAAPPAPPAPPMTVMSKLEFLRRFTQPERIAIRAHVGDDPVIADVNQLMELADAIDVADPDTVNYVGYLASKGYIAQTRVAALLEAVA